MREDNSPYTTNNGGISSDKGKSMEREKNFDGTVKRRKNDNKKGVLTAIVLLCIIVVVGGYLCYTKLFKIGKLEIEGSCPYTEEQMLEGMGVSMGDLLYGLSNDEIKHNIKYNLAYIDSVEISRIWPSTLKVKVNKANPTFYISIDDTMYVLSQSLRVLSKTDSIEEVELHNLAAVEMIGIKSCVEGEYLKADDKTCNTLIELYSVLEEYGVAEEITTVDITNRFDIQMMYGTKFLVKLGDSVNLKTKVEFMLSIIKELGEDVTGGIIDVSDEDAKEGTFENFT